MSPESELEYVVVVTSRGMFDCLLDCGIVSLEAAKEAIRESKDEDFRQGWQYEYRYVPITRANKSLHTDVAMCEDCGKNPALEGCSVCAECGL